MVNGQLILETWGGFGYKHRHMFHFIKIMRQLSLAALFLALLSCQGSDSSTSLDLRNRVKRVVLDNGMKILLLKRQGAPVFSAQIKVRVGNVEEQVGSFGLAHFFEHMAFKGTDKIGTNNYIEEKKILDQIFEIGTKIVNMRKQGKDPKEYADLIKKRKELEQEQKKYLVKNEFTQIYQKNGGINLNATTSNDYTSYYISLPVNKMELWAYMESSRMKKPVIREFFTEVDVVAEERRMRLDNTPDGRLYEAYVNKAFDKSPYKIAVIGPAKDIQNYTPQVAMDFYKTYYIPSRMVVAVVGNFDMKEAERIVRKYFSTIPGKKENGHKIPTENFDKKTFPREVTITGPEKSRFYMGYHRPAHPHEDDIVLDVIQDILCEGRTSRLYKRLVLNKKATFAACYVSIPGARLDSLFTFLSMPLEGHKNKGLKKEIEDEIQKLAKEGPSEYELQKVKNNIDAELIYSLQSNSGLASQLAFYESLTGHWEYLYDLQARVHSITVDDVKRVVATYFVPQNQVAAYLEQKK